MKKRVYELGRPLSLRGFKPNNSELVAMLKYLGYPVKSHSSPLTEEQFSRALEELEGNLVRSPAGESSPHGEPDRQSTKPVWESAAPLPLPNSAATLGPPGLLQANPLDVPSAHQASSTSESGGRGSMTKASERLKVETSTLSALMDKVEAERTRSAPDAGADVHSQIRYREKRSHRGKELERLHEHAFAKVIVYRDVAGSALRTIRVTSADYSVGELSVFPPNAPLVRVLNALEPGETAEFNEKDLEVVELSYLERHRPVTGHEREFKSHRFWTLGAKPRDERVIGAGELTETFFWFPTATQQTLLHHAPVQELVVTGVAGSGKTSVALGYMAMQRFKAEDGTSSRFQPHTGLGIVRGESLVPYLKGLREGQLDLGRLPVHSLENLREDWVRSVFQHLRRWNPRRSTDSLVGSSAWFREVCLGLMDRLLNDRIRAFREAVVADLQTTELGRTLSIGERFSPRLKEVSDVWRAIAAALPERCRELQRQSNDVFEILGGLGAFGTGVWQRYREQVAADVRAETAEEMKSQSHQVLTAIDLPQEYAALVADDRWLGEALRRSGWSLAADEVIGLRNRLAQSQFSDSDLDLLLLCHSKVVRQFANLQMARKWPHYTHAFVDEFQDFTQVQLDLVRSIVDEPGMVVCVGDYAQRVSRSASGTKLATPTVHLSENKRQSNPLGLLSSSVRRNLLKDDREITPKRPADTDVFPFRLAGPGQNEGESLCQELVRLRKDSFFKLATVGVICPTLEMAQTLVARLSPALEVEGIVLRAPMKESEQVQFSAHDVHVSTAASFKGLEFDAVYILSMDSYDLSEEIHRNMLYVATSRARHILGLSWGKPLQPELADILRDTEVRAACNSTTLAFPPGPA